MTRDEYKKVKAVAKVIASFYRPGFPVDAKNPGYDNPVGKTIKSLRDFIQTERTFWKAGMITENTPSDIMKTGIERVHVPTKQRIKKLIRERLEGKRTDVEVEIGKRVYGDKTPKTERSKWASGPLIEVTVGHMWERKVHNEFYRDGNLDSNWFVLRAEEIRVNKKHQFRMFEAMFFHPDNGETREGYIVKATIGKKQADIAFNAANAVDKGLAILNQAVRERVIQKEDTNDQ